MIAAIRWTARIVGALVAGIFMLFLIGSGLSVNWQDAPLIALRCAESIGVPLAWKHELAGGTLILVCATAATLIRPWVPAMTAGFLLSGVFFVLAGLLQRSKKGSVLPV